jgi:hypothetical protein
MADQIDRQQDNWKWASRAIPPYLFRQIEINHAILAA